LTTVKKYIILVNS